MTSYKVIKSHDGIPIGEVRIFDGENHLADEMVALGYWEKIESKKTSKTKSKSRD